MSRNSLITTFRELMADSTCSEEKKRALASMLGNAVGDALGSPLEFQPAIDAASARKQPQYEMVSGGNFRLHAGQYTDDFAQALALAHVLETKKAFNPTLFLDNLLSWWDKAQFSSGGRQVGLGANVGAAMHNRRLQRKGSPTLATVAPPTTLDVGYACAARNGSVSPTHGGKPLATFDGNGTIMRASPAAVFAQSVEQAMLIAAQQSYATTQGKQAADCARLVAYLCYQAINDPRSEGETDAQFKDRLLSTDNMKRFVALSKAQQIFPDMELGLDPQLEKMVIRVPQMEYRAPANDRFDLRAGGASLGRPWFNWWESVSTCPSGDTTYFGSYAMDAMAITLHALQSTRSFGGAVSTVAARRGDADSNAAVTGTIAGAIYGLNAIPASWVEAVGNHAVHGDGRNILQIAGALHNCGLTAAVVVKATEDAAPAAAAAAAATATAEVMTATNSSRMFHTRMRAPDASLESAPLEEQVMAGLNSISLHYEGPHRLALDILMIEVRECTDHSEKVTLIRNIDKYTKVGGGLGNGKLNAALVELKRQIESREPIDSEFLGRLAADKSATKGAKPAKR